MCGAISHLYYVFHMYMIAFFVGPAALLPGQPVAGPHGLPAEGGRPQVFNPRQPGQSSQSWPPKPVVWVTFFVCLSDKTFSKV